MIDVRPLIALAPPVALLHTIRGAHSSIKLSNFGATIWHLVPDVYGRRQM